ncbi:hypothetical protein LEMLEM_LOCUS22441, partial [Lemmus lemmus]
MKECINKAASPNNASAVRLLLGSLLELPFQTPPSVHLAVA